MCLISLVDLLLIFEFIWEGSNKSTSTRLCKFVCVSNWEFSLICEINYRWRDILGNFYSSQVFEKSKSLFSLR